MKTRENGAINIIKKESGACHFDSLCSKTDIKQGDGNDMGALTLQIQPLTDPLSHTQGHCMVLMEAIEHRMQVLGVRIMALPATHDATRTWITGFGFRCAQSGISAFGWTIQINVSAR
eukprot:scaffold307297_cov18-Tisochrysis_lutea.AAC.1